MQGLEPAISAEADLPVAQIMAAPLTRSYIVVFKVEAQQATIDTVAKQVEGRGGKIGHRYDTVLRGFSVSLPQPFDIDWLRGLDSVDYVEADQQVSIDGSRDS